MKPTTTPTEPSLPLVNACCCGIDVHKDSVFACVRTTGPDGRAVNEVRQFGTTTAALLGLGDWLSERCVTSVAMESTGVYWKPVWNLLEGRANRDGEAIALMLVNARHMKNVPGRETDVKDCQWIAQLLAAGLLSPSFVPDRPQRELRDLTRQRAQLVGDKARFANRLQKVLEDANVKLASVATDVLGVSGRDILAAMIEGKQTPAQMAELARGALRRKIPALTDALTGGVNEHHRFMLKALLEQVEHAERQVAAFDARIEAVMPPLAREAVERLDAIPGPRQAGRPEHPGRDRDGHVPLPHRRPPGQLGGDVPRQQRVGREAPRGPDDRGGQVAQSEGKCRGEDHLIRPAPFASQSLFAMPLDDRRGGSH